MRMQEVATIQFTDADSGDKAVAIVRAGEAHVALCLSLLSNGDIEVVMGSGEGTRLVEALQRAISIGKAPDR